MKIIVDAMGGDFAPLAPVKGALMAQEKYGVDIVLTGKTEEILKALQQCGCKELPKGMEIANATEVVEICDDPATAFKHKKDSSLTVGLNMLHAGDADGFVSAGSTGRAPRGRDASRQAHPPACAARRSRRPSRRPRARRYSSTAARTPSARSNTCCNLRILAATTRRKCSASKIRASVF